MVNKDVAYWRSRKMCGPILRYLAGSGKWLGIVDLQKALGGRSAPIALSLSELIEAGLLQDRWAVVEQGRPACRQYTLTEKGAITARLLDT